MTRIENRKLKIEKLFFPALIAAAYLIGLGALPLLGPDEPRYAQVAREMFERGDWITPTLGGFHWFEKPALAYWLMIVSYKIFGVNEFAARFGSAVFGLLTVLTVYWLAKSAVGGRCEELGNRENARSSLPLTPTAYYLPPSADSWALLVGASSIGLLVFAHAATFDIVLTFPVTAALACFYAAEIKNQKSKIKNQKWFFAFYFFVGVGLLAKGLIGAVLPFAIIFCYFVARRRLPDAKFVLSLVWGFFVVVAVAATWYAPMYWRHGWTFVDEFFVQHHFARYTSNKYAHPEPFWFFWAILPALALPWTPFLFAAIWRFFTKPKTDLQIFAVVWLVVPLVFFSFSGSKLPGYILPALPAAILLAVPELARFTEKSRNRARALKILAAAVLVGVVVGIQIAKTREAVRRDTAKFLVQAAAEKNFTSEKVLNLHDISHSLEFYAAGRLARNKTDGRQIKFQGIGEIAAYLRENGEPTALVLTPLEYENQLRTTDLLESVKITDDGAFALYAVSQK